VSSTAEPLRVTWSEVAFGDLIPPGLEPYECWNAIGMDPAGCVYVGFTSSLPDGRDDVLIIRYDPSRSERVLLGTFMQAADAAGNLARGESIPKGHTRLIFQDGRMYMGSQSFHDLKGATDDLETMRGAHLFAYELDRGALVDLSASLPGGVVIRHQGIVSLDILPEQHLLVGLAHPSCDIILYDYRKHALVDVLPGIAWKLGNPLSRELIAATSGRIFTYRGTEWLGNRNESHPIYVHDLATRRLMQTPYIVTEGFWVGKTATRDGRKVFVSTTHGRLYEFDTASEAFTDLGHMLPAADYAAGRRIDHLYALTLSPDEKQIYCIPAQLSGPAGSGELYAYEIASREVRFVEQLPPGVYTSGDARDSRRVYFAHFGTVADPWHGRTRLMVLEVMQE
jgi:hypothetical protein